MLHTSTSHIQYKGRYQGYTLTYSGLYSRHSYLEINANEGLLGEQKFTKVIQIT